MKAPDVWSLAIIRGLLTSTSLQLITNTIRESPISAMITSRSSMESVLSAERVTNVLSLDTTPSRASQWRGRPGALDFSFPQLTSIHISVSNLAINLFIRFLIDFIFLVFSESIRNSD